MHAGEVDYLPELWARLLSSVRQWAAGVREVPGGLEILIEDRAGDLRTVEVVVTPTQWDEYASVIHGTTDADDTPFKDAVLHVPPGVPYLVYDGAGGWEHSVCRELDGEVAETGPGEWLTEGVDGTVHLFRDAHED